MRVRRVLVWIVVVMIVLAGAIGGAVYRAVGTFPVAIPESLKGKQPGALVAVERTAKYPSFVVQYLIDSVHLPEPIDVTHGITVYRVKYRTTNHDGAVVVASGLVALPNGAAAGSVVSYHHGTTAQRNTAPSQPRFGEGTLIAAAVSGLGHITVAPDYIGLGTNRDPHPYMHAQTTAATSVDLLSAAHALVEHLGEWPSSLYLIGFSQGGHATFAVQRHLEELDDPRFDVQAAAPIAGPFHLRDVSFPQALTGESDSHAFYLAYLATAYAHIYGQPLESVLTAAYAGSLPALFDGDHESAEISAAMPDDPRSLFNPEFLTAYDNGEPHWFLQALEENDVDDWTPAAPVRLFYGDKDLDVLPEEARRAEAAMKQLGADVTAISVGPYDHNGSAQFGIPRAILWFDELAEQ